MNTYNDSTGFQPAPDTGDNNPDAVGSDVLAVGVGKAMPPTLPAHLPVLDAQMPLGGAEGAEVRSLLAEGMQFVGNATLRGPFSVAGLVEGNLAQAPNALASIVVTETGSVKGDITAHRISIMGHTEGILDAGQGEVSLHDTADVHGLVRYGRIQVNGANLNATLERAPPPEKSLD
jgi:cytoskeletal protein CcmA (bactofilin family)